MVLGGGVYPHVGLICTHCGNTHFINAMVSGVLENPAAQQPPAPTADEGVK